MTGDASPSEREVYEFQYTPPAEAEAASDRRIGERSSLRVQARILVDDEAIDANTVDLSAHGLAVTSTRQLNIDQECSVELGISVASLASPPMLRASVRYCAQLGEGRFRIGMKFTAVSIEAAELLVGALAV
jgi:PilZ domain-containing protein